MFRLATFIAILTILGMLVFGLGNRGDAGLDGLAASTVSVGDLLKNATGYDGKIVRTDGVVGNSIGILGAGAFHLRNASDGSEIVVIASGGIPPMGITLTVTGTFKQAIVIGNFQYAVIVQDF